jgi:hypothetical protein
MGMRIEFQVRKAGNIIYRLDFPADEGWQFAEYSKFALSDFNAKHPNVSLLGDDVEMKWVKL